MGRVEPPFLYDPPSKYSIDGSFNPKAVTQASWAPRQERPKANGPLINLNRHPDSVSSQQLLVRWLIAEMYGVCGDSEWEY
jgi:hypothetical protein